MLLGRNVADCTKPLRKGGCIRATVDATICLESDRFPFVFVVDQEKSGKEGEMKNNVHPLLGAEIRDPNNVFEGG